MLSLGFLFFFLKRKIVIQTVCLFVCLCSKTYILLTARARTTPMTHADAQVWIKPNQEQSFLYGNHVLKGGLGRMTEGTPKYESDIDDSS